MVNCTWIISSSRKYYRRYYRLVVIAVIIMMAVLTGSLLLGDSVRGTLSDRVDERLGTAETILTSGTGFMDEKIMQSPLLANAHGYLLTQGFLSVDGKLIPVYIWGTDTDTITMGEALINEPLSNILISPSGAGGATQIALHLPAHSLVPSGSLFVSKSYSTQMRVSIKGVKSVKDGGNILLKNEQTHPLNVFVNRKQLGTAMQLEGKINIILSDDFITERQIESVCEPEFMGFHFTDSTLTYDGVFIPDEIVHACNPYTTYLAYLVNEIICKTDTVPYSFVTAVSRWKGAPLSGREIILSDYAANRLHVGVGDSVRMAYFIARDMKNLETKEQIFRVRAVEPLSAFIGDSLLTADFPGLTNVERCSDWDSDLPIKMDHIHKRDEDFWYKYRQTPKAIVAYDAVRADWSNSFGTATALRIENTPTPITHHLSPTVIHPREQGMFLANSGTDFSSLFMALGFFIILSAIFLMQNPLMEMYAQRKDELQLYAQLGFTHRTIQRIMYRETFSVILFASPFGVLAGLLYSALILWLLGNVWSGATHTEGFVLHVNTLTLILGWLIGVLVCALSLWVIKGKIQRSKDKGQRSKDKGSRPPQPLDLRL